MNLSTKINKFEIENRHYESISFQNFQHLALESRQFTGHFSDQLGWSSTKQLREPVERSYTPKFNRLAKVKPSEKALGYVQGRIYMGGVGSCEPMLSSLNYI